MVSCWHRPDDGDVWIMGVLNCTPDSFSDGGHFIDSQAAIAHGLSMFKSGAALIDVGGESTRPGAQPVTADEELHRVMPVIRGLVQKGCRVSIDTMKAAVMQQAIKAGASLVNDVSALRHDPESLDVVADMGVDVCLMHMQGEPANMQLQPQYNDVLAEVMYFFEQRIEACLSANIAESAILLDPGIGFGKRLQDNLALIQGLTEIKNRFSMPLLLGVSRKSFLGQLTHTSPDDRELETAVAGGFGIAAGADMLRVHNVDLQSRAIRVASALSSPHPKTN